MRNRLIVMTCVMLISAAAMAEPETAGGGWVRHVIDDTSDGADGVRLADVNGNGLLDITTGWEEGNVVRVYLNPGRDRVRERWPSVTVGRVNSPEDAVFADVDGNGVLDVISSCEGNERTVYVHWAPTDPAAYLDETQWKTEPIPASRGMQQWMFAAPYPRGEGVPVDIFAAGKNENAALGYFRAGENPRALEDWTWHPIRPVGWIMSLKWADMNGNGLMDLLFSDRRGDERGVYWLRNPGESGDWDVMTVGLRDYEVMFLDVADLDGNGETDLDGNGETDLDGNGETDLDGNGETDIVVATRGGPIMRLSRNASGGWDETAIEMPERTGTGKGIGLGDINKSGRTDIVFSCENARDLRGLMALIQEEDGSWTPQDIDGLEGVKFDLVKLVDMTGNGYLDVLTCEEGAGGTGLGVIWYENPAK